MHTVTNIFNWIYIDSDLYYDMTKTLLADDRLIHNHFGIDLQIVKHLNQFKTNFFFYVLN